MPIACTPIALSPWLDHSPASTATGHERSPRHSPPPILPGYLPPGSNPGTPTQQPGTPYRDPQPYPVARTPYLGQIPLRPYKRRRACERIGRWSGPVRSLAHALRHREGSRGSSYPVSLQRVCYILFVVSDVWRSTDHSIIRSPPGHSAG